MWGGPTDHVALGELDSDPAKLIQRGPILDAFGDRLDLELARNPDDRLDDPPVFFVAEQILDELHVDLEVGVRDIAKRGAQQLRPLVPQHAAVGVVDP
jgi:hypothetical protein